MSSPDGVSFAAAEALISWQVNGKYAVRWPPVHSLVTGQLADTPTRGLPTRGLDNSRIPTMWT